MDETSLLAIRNAIENSSTEPVDDADILRILCGDGGHRSHVRAVFEDTSYHSLERAGAAHGIPRATILGAYRAAQQSVAAVNPELDAALRGNW